MNRICGIGARVSSRVYKNYSHRQRVVIKSTDSEAHDLLIRCDDDTSPNHRCSSTVRVVYRVEIVGANLGTCKGDTYRVLVYDIHRRLVKHNRVAGRSNPIKGHARSIGYRNYLRSRIPGSVCKIYRKGYGAVVVAGLHHPRRRIAVSAKIVHRIRGVAVYRHRGQTKQRFVRGETQRYDISRFREGCIGVVRDDSNRVKGRRGFIKGDTCCVGHHRYLSSRIPNGV